MIRTSYMQCELCTGETMAEAVAAFNSTMKRLSKQVQKHERIDGGFLIYFMEEETLPENLADIKELQGIKHKCRECSHCNRPLNRFGKPDGRYTKIICEKKGKLVNLETRACDDFYEEGQDIRDRIKLPNYMTNTPTDRSA